jgi:zeta-carotene desaturase
MQDWLQKRRQTPGAMERFWRVVLVSALDEELDRTDARWHRRFLEVLLIE